MFTYIYVETGIIGRSMCGMDRISSALVVMGVCIGVWW